MAILDDEHSVVPISIPINKRSREVRVSQTISGDPAISVAIVLVEGVKRAQTACERERVVVLEETQ